MGEIDWTAAAERVSGNRYGVNLIELLGTIGEACQIHGRCPFPFSTLIIAIVEYQNGENWLVFADRKNGTHVTPTALGEATLG